MWGNIVAIHSVLKKKNYKAKFSTSSIYIKKKSTKTILEKKQKNHKKRKKNYVGKHCSNSQCFKEKTTKLNS